MSNKRKRAANPLIQPIDTGSILSDPNNDAHLIGKAPMSGPLYDGLVVISSFIRQHQFLSAGNNVGASASAVSVQDYIKIINEFQDFMQTRQITGLRSNTTSASAAELQKIQDCHHDALQHGLNFVATQDTWFDNTNFHAIHSKLCPDDAQSGRFRNNKVRASNTLFTRPENIQEQFHSLSIAIKRYQTKWASFPSAMMDEKQWVNQVFCQISLVAIVLFGIVDIHPYRDGNGRTARIYMNIALKRILGLPFPVTVTGNVEQRKEYVDALRESRSRLLRVSKGENLTDSGQSVFQHLIEVVMDRILHHVVEINSLIEAKAQSAAAEDEARILRRWREKAATAQCCICLDNNPNVTTICCGQPVHMNCMAEWLSNQGTCITCRKAIPRMALRSLNSTTNANAANANVPNVGNNIDTETTEDAEDVDSTTEDDTTDETTEDDNDAQQNDYETTEDTTDETTEDDNNAQQDDNDTTEDSTTEDDTTDDTESVQPAAQPRSRFCGHCHRNKFAVDCSNELCGRCCQLYGSSHCVRHNC